MSNKSNGTAFEREFAEMLSERGFWVHLLKDNSNGQPFDVIATKNNQAYAFDCKICEHEDFSLYRAEVNQMYAMQVWKDCGNREGLFAVKTPSGIWMMKHSTIADLIEKGHRRLRGKTIRENSVSFEEWIHESNNQ